MLYAASAGLTRRLMSAPFSRSITAISYWLCRSSQNCALLPKYRPSRTAVSAVMERRPLSMSVMRPDGTPRSSASRLALSLREPSSRFKSRPGCTAGAIFLPLVIVDDFHIECIAFAEFKANTPTAIYPHGPLLFPFTLQLVQSNAPQRAEVLKRFSDVQCQKQIRCGINVEATELI